eukprot:TRINITY_DN28518_c0_g1_i1.p1 TRINITY_DN28518_c0_g1~~TRINITY_DN28518_c0_g1_i1.p1  ORF type:complete len:453 (+),score=115.34 TRINITY_DN28518_c0_g1_i1:50-1408(+)
MALQVGPAHPLPLGHVPPPKARAIGEVRVLRRAGEGLGLQFERTFLTGVRPGSKAAAAGALRFLGCAALAVNGTPVRSDADIGAAVRGSPAGIVTVRFQGPAGSGAAPNGWVDTPADAPLEPPHRQPVSVTTDSSAGVGAAWVVRDGTQATPDKPAGPRGDWRQGGRCTECGTGGVPLSGNTFSGDRGRYCRMCWQQFVPAGTGVEGPAEADESEVSTAEALAWVFSRCDHDRDGVLSFSEVQWLAEKTGGQLTMPQWQRALEALGAGPEGMRSEHLFRARADIVADYHILRQLDSGRTAHSAPEPPDGAVAVEMQEGDVVAYGRGGRRGELAVHLRPVGAATWLHVGDTILLRYHGPSHTLTDSEGRGGTLPPDAVRLLEQLRDLSHSCGVAHNLDVAVRTLSAREPPPQLPFSPDDVLGAISARARSSMLVDGYRSRPGPTARTTAVAMV